VLFFKSFFLFFLFFFFAACVNPRLVRSEPEPNRTNRNRFCSVPRFAKNRSVPICREPNLCHKPKNRTETDRLTERPGRVGPVHPLDLQACVPAVAAARKREGSWKGGRRWSSWELEGRRGEGATELQQWRRLLLLDGRGERSECVLLTSE